MSDATPKPAKEDLTQKDSIERVFLANAVLPDAATAFCERVASVEDAVKTALIVLDTNVLLLPYGAGASSLKDVITVFKNLKQEGRLYLPAQVAREFIRNRPSKLGDLQQGLSDKISRLSVEKLSFPILEEVPEYQELNEALGKAVEMKKQLTKINAALVKKIRSWQWNDPVNSAYREVFTADRIVEPKFDQAETLAELARRQRLLIPPGYKDAAKEDSGIGDFLIWKTILEMGGAQKKDLIFISGDEKADWQHRTSNSGFLPRYELLDEYRRSSGKSFYIIPLSTLLELLKVESTSIAEIKEEEKRIHDIKQMVYEANTVVTTCPTCASQVESLLATHLGASAKPYCLECENPFHIHRTRDGVTAHKVNSTLQGETVENVVCPRCDHLLEISLGNYPKATRWHSCGKCQAHFAIHRKNDGHVRIGRVTNIDIGDIDSN